VLIIIIIIKKGKKERHKPDFLPVHGNSSYQDSPLLSFPVYPSRFVSLHSSPEK
jgi:hypothetical protein